MPDTLLAMEHVTAGYLGDIDVLRDVSLTVQAGRISGLIGLNGAGKSTLMKAICGFLPPKSGRVTRGGRDISGQAPHRMIDDGLWYIPQESSLFPYLTVEENLRLPLEGRRKRYGDVLEPRFADTLDRFPVLKEKLKDQAGNLSGWRRAWRPKCSSGSGPSPTPAWASCWWTTTCAASWPCPTTSTC
jgi:branched-chain amino acid transport system ATP-binding protein